MSSLLIIENLSKSFLDGPKPIQILNDLNLTVERRDTIAICGPSGCGKSTMISCIAGLLAADRGKILFEGTDLCKKSTDERAKFRAKKFGVVFQQFHLLPHLTALENVRFPLDLAGVAGPEAEERSVAAIQSVGLIDRKDHFPHEMSRGECQRTAIARVFVFRPTLILADEPTASLDSSTGKSVMLQMIDLVNRHGSTLIVVTHDPKIASLCKRQFDFTDGHLKTVRV